MGTVTNNSLKSQTSHIPRDNWVFRKCGSFGLTDAEFMRARKFSQPTPATITQILKHVTVILHTQALNARTL